MQSYISSRTESLGIIFQIFYTSDISVLVYGLAGHVTTKLGGAHDNGFKLNPALEYLVHALSRILSYPCNAATRQKFGK